MKNQRVNSWIKCGKAAAWLGDEGRPPVSVSLTLTEGDLRTLYSRLNEGEVKLSIGLFDNNRYIEGTSTPAYTGDGSIRISVAPVQATPAEAQAIQRTVARKAKAGMSAPQPTPAKANPDIASVVAAVMAAMGGSPAPAKRGRPLGSKNAPKVTVEAELPPF